MKNIKHIMLSFVLLIVLCSTINIRYVNALYGTTEPKLYVENGVLPEAKIGDSFKLNLTISNKSKYFAKEVKVAPQLNSEMLEVNDLLNYQMIDKLVSTKNQTVTFNLRVKETAKPGVYPMTVNFSYKDASNRSHTSTSSTIYLKIVDGAEVPNLGVRTVLVNPDEPRAGKDAEYTIEVVNKGDRAASDIQFSLIGLSSQTYTINNGINKRTHDLLNGGESTTFKYNLNLFKELKTGVHSVQYLITYKDQFGREYKEEAEFYTTILAKDDGGLAPGETAPKIILSSYNTNPKIVLSGGNFDLAATFYNTNKSTSVRNIKVTMEMKESEDTSDDTQQKNVFTPVNSTNVVYIEELQPHESSDCFISFNVAKSAEAKTYIMVLEMEYEDKKGNEYKSQEEIYIRVSQEPDLGIENINYREEIGLNEDSWFNTYLYNKSGVDIYNILVKIEGENIEADKATHYVGSLNKYSSKGIDTTIRATAEGKITGFVTFTYEDATGKQYEQKKQFDMTCVNYYNRWKPEEPVEEEPQGTPVWKKALRIMGIGLVVIIALVVFLKKRKKAKIRKLEQQLISEIMQEE